jgi:hypothetical protein
MSVTYSKSLTCTLIAEYPKGEMPIVQYDITGVEDFAKKYEADPVLYLTFAIDSSGLPALISAEARTEVVETEAESTNTTDTEGAASNKTEEEEGEGEQGQDTEKKENETDTKAQKKKVKKLTLDLKLTNLEFPSPLTIGAVKATAARLVSLAKEDADRRKTAEARSELESYIYFLRERLDEDTFRKVTTEGERDKLEKLLSETRDWLDGPDFSTASHSTVEERKEKLQKVSKDAEERESELIKREEAIADAFKQLEALNATMKTINETKPWISQEDKDEAFKKVNETTVWLKAKIAEQEAQNPWEAPAFKVSQVKNKLAGAAKAVDKVKRMQKPKEKTESKDAGAKKANKKPNKMPDFFNFGPGMDSSNIKMENVRIGDEVYNYDPNSPDEEKAPETDIREEL